MRNPLSPHLGGLAVHGAVHLNHHGGHRVDEDCAVLVCEFRFDTDLVGPLPPFLSTGSGRLISTCNRPRARGADYRRSVTMSNVSLFLWHA